MSKYDAYPVPAIAELLEDLCPEGVHFVPIGNLVTVGKKTSTPAAMGSETVYLYSLPAFDGGCFPEITSPPSIKSSKRVIEDSVLLVPKLNPHKPRVWQVEDPAPNSYASTEYFLLYPRLDSVSLAFLNYSVFIGLPRLLNHVNRGSNSHHRLPLENYLSLEIPLPPLEVQEQITTILDTFTDLDASLNRELELRNDQFTHALDSVFGNSTAPRSTLGQVGDFTKGKGITKSQLQDEGRPAFHYGQVHTSYGHSTTSTISHVDPALIKNPTLAHPGDIILATTSEDDEAVGKAVAWLGDEDAVVGGDAYVYSHSLEPRYVSYFFASHDFQLQKGSKVYGTKVRRINDKGLSALKIPVPAPEVQEQIADTLDLFTDYTFNLRREIDLRRQQLEFYREQLLTFPVTE